MHARLCLLRNQYELSRRETKLDQSLRRQSWILLLSFGQQGNVMRHNLCVGLEVKYRLALSGLSRKICVLRGAQLQICEQMFGCKFLLWRFRNTNAHVVDWDVLFDEDFLQYFPKTMKGLTKLDVLNILLNFSQFQKFKAVKWQLRTHSTVTTIAWYCTYLSARWQTVFFDHCRNYYSCLFVHIKMVAFYWTPSDTESKIWTRLCNITNSKCLQLWKINQQMNHQL